MHQIPIDLPVRMRLYLIAATLLGLSSAQSFARLMLDEINRARGQYGVPPLCILPRLNSIAQSYTNLQALKGLGGHYVDGLTPEIRAGRYAISAENLFEGYAAAGCGSPRFAIRELLRDALHRDNILSPEFTHVGIGRRMTYRRGQPYFYWAQIFVRSRQPCPSRRRLYTFPEMIMPPNKQVTVKRTVQEPYPGAGVRQVEEVRKTIVDPAPRIDDRGFPLPLDDYYDPGSPSVYSYND